MTTTPGTHAPLGNMGPHMRGVSPPFTPSGKASFTASGETTPEGRTGQRGILVRWKADRTSAESLLPPPLEPVEHTNEISMLLSELQSGLSREFIMGESPLLTNWNEAVIQIPCRFGDVRTVFSWVTYVNLEYDAGVPIGLFRGFITKGARFSSTFPMVGQPMNEEMAPGGVATMNVARMDERIISCTFEATSELAADEIDDAVVGSRELLRAIGVRFMPDWANPGSPPLVHDLVHWDREEGTGGIVRAWRGDAVLSFGDSDSEELDLLAPVEMLPSHFVHLEVETGAATAQVIHSYVDREKVGNRIVRTQTDTMGSNLKGVSPPFTPRGTAAFGRSTDLGGEAGAELAQAGHHGILLRWRADAETVKKLLPPPLEFTPTSDRIYCFLNQTQTGLNKFREAGESGLKHMTRVNPHHVNWHEALFWIPCAYKGMRAHFDYCLYKDEDHGIVLGMFDGFWTKLVTFHKTFPFATQPLNREMAPGTVSRVSVSRFDEKMVEADFTCTQELSAEEIRDELDLTGEMLNSTGLRYFPDYANPGGPPLVHDLVMWNMAAGHVSRAWRGDVKLTLGTSDYEELHLFEPLEMLPSYYIDLRYKAGPGICKILHDYVAEPIS